MLRPSSPSVNQTTMLLDMLGSMLFAGLFFITTVMVLGCFVGLSLFFLKDKTGQGIGMILGLAMIMSGPVPAVVAIVYGLVGLAIN